MKNSIFNSIITRALSIISGMKPAMEDSDTYKYAGDLGIALLYADLIASAKTDPTP